MRHDLRLNFPNKKNTMAKYIGYKQRQLTILNTCLNEVSVYIVHVQYTYTYTVEQLDT